MENRFDAVYDQDYRGARNKAWLNSIRARLTGRSNRLLSFEDVRDRLHLGGPIYRGRQTVPVKSVVGSVNRYLDFDRAFMPTEGANPWRWKAINRAFYHLQDLPPVQLYQVGDVYFVLDGHNRISVAREHGVEFVDADVMEVKARVPLTPEIDANDLERLGEYEEFLERTELDRIRPEQEITFTIAGGYSRLLEHIAVHRYFMGQTQKRTVTEPEAVASWYDTVYLPTVQIIRQDEILADFPGRTESDLYLWLMDHLYYLRQQGRQMEPKQSARDFVDQYSRQRLRSLRRRLYRSFGGAGSPSRPAPGVAPPPNMDEV